MDPLIRLPVLSRRTLQLRRPSPPAPVVEPAPVPAPSVARVVPAPLASEPQDAPLRTPAPASALSPDAPTRLAGPAPPSPPDASALREAALHAAMEEAIASGFAKGVAEGRAEAAAGAKAELERLAAIVGQLQHASAQALMAAEDDVVALVFTCLCRMIGSAAPSRAAVVAMVGQAVALASARDDMVIRLHPGDLAMLQADPDPALVERAPHALWRPDQSVELGGCIVETTAGALDARLDQQLAGVRTILLRTRQQRSAVPEAPC